MTKLNPEQINYLYPVTGCYFTQSGIQVRRGSRAAESQNRPQDDKKRGKVKGLSQRSLHRLAFLVSTSNVRFLSLMTLTYGEIYPQTGTLTRKHRNTFLTWMRRKFDPLSYVWFLEFQRRGAPHIHLLLSSKSPGRKLEIEAGSRWCKVVSRDFPDTYEKMMSVHCYQGDPRKKMWSDIRKADGANRYMRKYAGKESQKCVPLKYSDVGRFWGTSRDVPRPIDDMLECTMVDADLRRLLNALGREDVSKWDVIPKYVHISQ